MPAPRSWPRSAGNVASGSPRFPLLAGAAALLAVGLGCSARHDAGRDSPLFGERPEVSAPVEIAPRGNSPAGPADRERDDRPSSGPISVAEGRPTGLDRYRRLVSATPPAVEVEAEVDVEELPPEAFADLFGPGTTPRSERAVVPQGADLPVAPPKGPEAGPREAPPEVPQPAPPARPEAAAPPVLRVATWNVKRLGRSSKVEARPEVVARFDLVALQEVLDLRGLEKLRKAVEKLTGEAWETHASRRKSGSSAKGEYPAFLYRKSAVRLVSAGRDLHKVPRKTFDRPPFAASFRTPGGFDLTLITHHGRAPDQTIAARSRELVALAAVYREVQDADPDEDDVLVAGDFNVHGPWHEAFEPLRDEGLIPAVSGRKAWTTYSAGDGDQLGANFYDNLWLDPALTGAEGTGRSGILHLHELPSVTPGLSRDRLLDHMQRYSDHCPVWVEFRADVDDDPMPSRP